MAYTQADLEKVERAIIDLAAGERVVEVRFGAGEVTRYDSSTGLPQLLQLRDCIRAELAAAAQGKRIRGYRLRHNRGF
ncbi:hypothetical protein [Pseudomonas boanensis]|uniref:hypothetical protein n=1 Tax=Metapseudomonas boanensis TaxID=2822138 RepID=UPI0035D4D752